MTTRMKRARWITKKKKEKRTLRRYRRMKIINTRLHGILDYTSALILLLPWITGYYETSKDSLVFTLLGAGTIVFSIITDYEFGLIKILPMKVHLVLDTLSALFLIVMPWIFTVTNYQYHWPTLLGVLELLVVIMSTSQPYRVNKQE